MDANTFFKHCLASRHVSLGHDLFSTIDSFRMIRGVDLFEGNILASSHCSRLGSPLTRRPGESDQSDRHLQQYIFDSLA